MHAKINHNGFAPLRWALPVAVSMGLLCCWQHAAMGAKAPAGARFKLGQHYQLLIAPTRNVHFELPTQVHPEPAIGFSIDYFFHYNHPADEKTLTALMALKPQLAKGITLRMVPYIHTHQDETLAKVFYIAQDMGLHASTAARRALFDAVQHQRFNPLSIKQTAHALASIALLPQLPKREQNALSLSVFSSTFQDKIRRNAKYRQGHRELVGLITALLTTSKFDLDISKAMQAKNLYHVQQGNTIVVGGLFKVNLAMAGGDTRQLVAIINALNQHITVQTRALALEQKRKRDAVRNERVGITAPMSAGERGTTTLPGFEE